MNDNRKYSRQLDLVMPSDLNFPILIVGAGGIGSWATLALAKMGCSNITVIDYDIVEAENMPSQLYSQVGMYKVEALEKEILHKTGVFIHSVRDTFQAWALNQPNTMYGIIIFAVDSIIQRKEILTYMLSQQIFSQLLVDARMAGELIRILTVNPSENGELIAYAQTLDSSKKVYEEPCTSKAVIYNTLLCGGLIASIVKKFAKKESIKSNIVFDITNLQIF